MRRSDESAERCVNLLHRVQADRERDASPACPGRFVHLHHEAVTIDVHQLGSAGEPVAGQPSNHQEQIVSEQLGRFDHQASRVLPERIRLRSGNVLRSQPSLGPVFVGQTSPGDLQAHPGKIERFDLHREPRMASEEFRLHGNLLESGNGPEVAL